MADDIFGDFDKESKAALLAMKFLNFEDIQKGKNDFFKTTNNGLNPVAKQNKFPQFPVGFKFTTLSTNDIGNNYYGNNPKFQQGGITVYTDDDIPIKGGTLDEVKVYGDRFVKEFNGFNFVLFATKNGALLLEQYKACVPYHDEIVLFLEINDSNNFFGSVMEIKVGEDVLKSKLPIADMIAFMRTKKVNLDTKDIIELIQEGKFQTKPGLFSWLYTVYTKVTNAIVNFVFEGLDLLNQGIIDLFDYLLIDEKHWNNEAEGYSSMFIPDAVYKLLEQGNDKKMVTAIVSPVIDHIEAIEKQALKGIKLLKPILPEKIYSILKNVINDKLKDLSQLKENVKGDEFTTFLKANLEIANAYLCGILNGIVEFIKGIFEIVAIVLNAIQALYTGKADPLYALSLGTEIFENIIGIIVAFDFKKFIINAFLLPFTLLAKLITFVKGLNFDLSKIKINLSKVGYVCGYIIGLIVAIIIDAFLTGGVKAVQDITKALEQFLTKPGVVLRDAIQTAGRKSVAAVETIIDLIATMASKLKNGAVKLFEDFKGFIDDVFKWLEELFGVNKTVIEELADDEELFRKILTGSGGGKRFTRNGLREIAKEIEKKYTTIGLKVEIVTLKTHPERYKRWTSYPNDVLASCRAHEIPPTMFLRHDATELTVQHEMWHLDDLRKLGFEEFNASKNWKLEELVWERVWKSKSRWTREELIDSYEYYKATCNKEGALYKKIDELEKLIKI
jgi:Metallopeptidase toxin 4